MLKLQTIRGMRIRAHAREDCDGGYCCLHKPSPHPLNSSPMRLRKDKGTVDRMCQHGFGHPDPDDAAAVRKVLASYDELGFGAHFCDGCCKARGPLSGHEGEED